MYKMWLKSKLCSVLIFFFAMAKDAPYRMFFCQTIELVFKKDPIKMAFTLSRHPEEFLNFKLVQALSPKNLARSWYPHKRRRSPF